MKCLLSGIALAAVVAVAAPAWAAGPMSPVAPEAAPSPPNTASQPAAAAAKPAPAMRTARHRYARTRGSTADRLNAAELHHLAAPYSAAYSYPPPQWGWGYRR